MLRRSAHLPVSRDYMLLALRHPRLWLVTGWILVILAVTASIVPVQHLPQPPGFNDKLEHFAAYALLSLWFAGIYPRSRYVAIAVGLFAMGIVIEGLQGTMHLGRQADLRDVIANTAGILIGLMLALLWLGGWAQRVEGWTRKS
jgi:VanZ family protein